MPAGSGPSHLPDCSSRYRTDSRPTAAGDGWDRVRFTPFASYSIQGAPRWRSARSAGGISLTPWPVRRTLALGLVHCQGRATAAYADPAQHRNIDNVDPPPFPFSPCSAPVLGACPPGECQFSGDWSPDSPPGPPYRLRRKRLPHGQGREPIRLSTARWPQGKPQPC